MRNKKILIIDDDQDLCHILKTYFVNLEYECILAENGEKGVELAISEAPDLIVMDLMLPGIDGLQATRIIREHPTTYSIPVLAMTAKVTAQDRSDCFQSGCNDHIGKPFTSRQLIACVEKLLNEAVTSPMVKEDVHSTVVG